MGSSKSKSRVMPPPSTYYTSPLTPKTRDSMVRTTSHYIKRVKRPEWEILDRLPFERFAKGIGMNENEFMIVSNSMDNTGKDGVYLYNMHKNKCIQLVNYKELKLGNVDNPIAALNKDRNILYIHCGIYNNHNLIKINLNNLQTKIIKNKHEIGHNAQCIIINNVYHIIGGWANNKHYIFEEDTNCFKEIHRFNEFESGFGDFGLIHLKTQQQLLLFGGKYGDIILDTIYSFCTVQNKWSKLDIHLPIPLYLPGLIKYNYDQYVLLFGGITGTKHKHKNTRQIFIFDINNNKIICSKIECPFKATTKAIRTSNYLYCLILISGYIRLLYHKWIGQNIIDLIIAQYGLNEYAHLIATVEFEQGGMHQKINCKQLVDFSLDAAKWINTIITNRII